MNHPRTSSSRLSGKLGRSLAPVIALTLTLWLKCGLDLAAAESSLADAAEKSDTTRIRSLLKERHDPNQPQPDGMTALHWAAWRGEVETTRLLLKGGASPNTTNRYGVAPISLACRTGNSSLVELLLTHGADPNSSLRGGETALHTAARTGRTGPVQALLQRGARVDARERRGQTPLCWAAADGHTEVVELLLRAGADLRTTLSDSGFTPMLFAARQGHREVVRTLLRAGADVNESTVPAKPGGKLPSKGTSALLLAIENGHYELALELIAAGADPNDQRSGYSPLHVMTWVRKPPRGEDFGAPPPPELTGMNSLQFVRALIQRGANVNLRLNQGRGSHGKFTPKGATPFFMASATSDLALMKLLLELGADPSIPNAEGCTPLLAACGIHVGSDQATEVAGEEPEVLEAVALLLKLGADINAVDANGETTMHAAALKNLPKVVQYLADHGARPEVWNRKNKFGSTPLMLAQGFRPGNFKPSQETAESIQRVMRSAGLSIPDPTDPSQHRNSDWEPLTKPVTPVKKP